MPTSIYHSHNISLYPTISVAVLLNALNLNVVFLFFLIFGLEIGVPETTILWIDPSFNAKDTVVYCVCIHRFLLCVI